MRKHILGAAFAIPALKALAEPYIDAGPAVIQLHVYGTLKEPLQGEQTVDFHERGTAFLVSPDGLVLSAGHNIPDRTIFDENGFHIEGYFPVKDIDALNAADPPVQLEVISATQLPYDVSLLRIKNLDTVKPFLRLCDAYKRGGGVDFEVLGYQGGDRLLTSNFGPVMAGAGTASNIVVQMPLNKGNSGGPIFNELGMVFGIAIGEKTVSSERMQSTSFAVPMAKVIQTLGDASKPLLGVSYEPDCKKALSNQITASIQLPIKVAQGPALVDWEYITQAQVNKSESIKEIKSPAGFKVIQYKGIDIDTPKVTAEVYIPKDGKTVLIKGTGQDLTTPNSANANITLVLEQAATEVPTSAYRVQTFPYSKTLEAHNVTITKKEFYDLIPAPPGFLFKEFVKIEYTSLNHSPSKGAKVNITKDGSALELRYSLESGPFYDRWRGWIDAYVTAKLLPKNK